MGEKKTPLRKCIGCNEMKDKKELIRIVRNKEGDMSIDLTGKMAGRGAYICKDRKCFDMAAKAKRLEKSFKCKIPDEIYDSLREEIPEE
jgi:predicted RNA-binding protein YlxR (DUF448 family)